MQKFVKIKIPETVQEQLVCRTCDLCGEESDRDGDWKKDMWEVNDTDIRVEIKQKEGTSYPEGGSGTEYEIDLCPKCFKNRLVPWLISQGAKIEEKEWDWG